MKSCHLQRISDEWSMYYTSLTVTGLIFDSCAAVGIRIKTIELQAVFGWYKVFRIL